jgi:hypothetical protein
LSFVRVVKDRFGPHFVPERAILLPKGGIDGSRVQRHSLGNTLIATLLAWELCMAETEQEKRSARRFALQIPVSVARGENLDQSEPAQLRDVSARGICLYLDSPIEQGSPLAFTLTLPPEITLTESIRVECKGRVLRVEGVPNNGKMAVAAVIEEYEFLPEG